MIPIQPVPLAIAQQRLVDQAAAHGDHGRVLEAEEGFVAEVVGCGGFAGEDYICCWWLEERGGGE